MAENFYFMCKQMAGMDPTTFLQVVDKCYEPSALQQACTEYQQTPGPTAAAGGAAMATAADPSTVRFVVLSDTHNQHSRFRGALAVPDGDVLVHLGDAVNRGDGEDPGSQTRSFARWFNGLPHRNKLLILGNHDRTKQGAPKNTFNIFAAELDARCRLLVDKTVEVDGVHIHGASYSSTRKPDYSKWPDRIVVLLTHVGSAGIRGVSGEASAHDSVQLGEVLQRAVLLHLFGHFHGASREEETHSYGPGGQTTFVNCANVAATSTHRCRFATAAARVHGQPCSCYACLLVAPAVGCDYDKDAHRVRRLVCDPPPGRLHWPSFYGGTPFSSGGGGAPVSADT